MADASDKRSSRRSLNTSQTTTLTELLSNSRHGSSHSQSASVLFQSKMFQSASAALDAYISEYDRSGTSSGGSYLQQSSSSTLSPFPQKLTVTSTARKEHDHHREERSLSSRALIDASYEEMRRADSEREKARALIETSKVLHDESLGQLSPLPGSSIVAGHLPSDIDSLATDALILAPSHVTSKHWTPHSSLDRYPTRLSASASLDDISRPHGVTFASSSSRNGSYVPKAGKRTNGYSSEDTDLFLQSNRSDGIGRYRQSHSAEETELLTSRSVSDDFSKQKYRRRSGSLPLDRPRYPGWLKELDVSGVSSVTRKRSEIREPSYKQVHRPQSGPVPMGRPKYPSWLKDLNVSGISSVTKATSEADDARYWAAQRPSSASVALDRPKGKYPSWLRELDVSGISSVTNAVRSDVTELPLNPGISSEESRSYLRHYPSVDALLTGEMDERAQALGRRELQVDPLSTPKSRSRSTGKLLSTVEKNGIKKELSRLKRLKGDMVAASSREVGRKGDKDFRFYKEDRRLRVPSGSHYPNGWENGLPSSEGTWNSVKPVISDSDVFKKPLFNGNRDSDTRKALGKKISPKRLTRPLSYKFRSGRERTVSFRQESVKQKTSSKHVSRSNKQKGKYIYWSDGSDSSSTNDLLLQWPRGSSRTSTSRDEALSLDTEGLLIQPPIPLLNLSPSASSNHSDHESASQKNSTSSSRSADSKVNALLSKAERVLNKPLPKQKLRPAKTGGGSPDTEEILSEERPWERHVANFRRPQPINKQNNSTDRRRGNKRPGIIGDFLNDVMDDAHSEDKEETLTGGEQPGPVEALKNMLFSMQSVQASTARLANGVSSDDSEEELTYLQEDSDIPSPVEGSPERFHTEPGAQSLDRALHHLSRLKLLVTTEEEGREKD